MLGVSQEPPSKGGIWCKFGETTPERESRLCLNVWKTPLIIGTLTAGDA